MKGQRTRKDSTSLSSKLNPEVQLKAECRRLSAEYKRHIIGEAEVCRHGELGSLLRREGLNCAQISNWRKAQAAGTLDKQQGLVANSNRAEIRHLKAENAGLKRKLERAEAIIEASKR
ncbi:MAG: hypothetical protein L0154_26730 [Chloroflexi bacterium]|nr:hypothetical protein [Chloroflexota bacterium]